MSVYLKKTYAVLSLLIHLLKVSREENRAGARVYIHEIICVFHVFEKGIFLNI